MEDDGLSEAWPKEFAELKELEKLLRCNICKDFMKTSLITGCSHLFCSYCIRQSIQYRNQCPACFAELYDNQLRPERTLDEVIRIFTSVKRKLLKRLQISYAACPGDEEETKAPDAKEQARTSAPLPPPSTPSLLFNSPMKSSTPLAVKPRTVPSMFSPKTVPQQTKLFSTSGIKREAQSNNSSAVNQEPQGSSIPSGSSSIPSGRSVPCPVCSVEIPERNINLHLDECLARANGAPPKSQPQNKPSRKPLPKLVLSLMKEKDLKQKCKEHGLSTLGDRKSLISRIQRYTTLYNSECDSLNPRSKDEIIRQIEREEKSLSSSASERKPLFSQVDRKTDPKVIEEVHAKYLQDNRTAFQKLIENMRERNGTRIVRSPRPSANRILSDDEDDLNPRLSGCESSSLTTGHNNPQTASTTTTIQIKTDPKTPISSLGDRRKHLPPLSPEIQIAPHSASNNSSDPPSYINHNVPSTTLSSPPRTRVTKSPSLSPDLILAPSSSPPIRQLFTPSPTVPSKIQSNLKPVAYTSPKEKVKSDVQSHASPQEQIKSDVLSHTSPQTRRSESPDLFMADGGDMDMFLTDGVEESEEDNTREQCASPDLLATTNQSCSSRSPPKSQITKTGHFVDSDSEPEIANETIVNSSYLGNSESAVESPNTKPTQPSNNKATSSFHSNEKSRYQSMNKQTDGCYDNALDRSHGNGNAAKKLLGGGDSDDDEDFLQLVQNKRGKRKTKELVFSPRTTRSKRMKP